MQKISVVTKQNCSLIHLSFVQSYFHCWYCLVQWKVSVKQWRNLLVISFCLEFAGCSRPQTWYIACMHSLETYLTLLSVDLLMFWSHFLWGKQTCTSSILCGLFIWDCSWLASRGGGVKESHMCLLIFGMILFTCKVTLIFLESFQGLFRLPPPQPWFHT